MFNNTPITRCLVSNNTPITRCLVSNNKPMTRCIVSNNTPTTRCLVSNNTPITRCLVSNNTPIIQVSGVCYDQSPFYFLSQPSVESLYDEMGNMLSNKVRGLHSTGGDTKILIQNLLNSLILHLTVYLYSVFKYIYIDMYVAVRLTRKSVNPLAFRFTFTITN